ncbi:MAG: energy-coupling factor ABC transporter permease [Fibrobacteres bacterium]|nr:energy-coupling factor ABC transporter permease [Fibrobacterota bacterium]
MHIMEGYLPVKHAIGWSIASAPFLGLGLHRISRWTRDNPSGKLFLGACAGFAFVLSALKIPSVTGSCSHPTGIGLGAVLLGPFPMMVLGTIVLLFQALFLAHGGLTTLGANAFSMCIVGSFLAWGVNRTAIGLRVPQGGALFMAAALSDLGTYMVTSFQLGLAFPSVQGGVLASTAKFFVIFVPTQLPLAISEGLLTVFVVNLLRSHLGNDKRFPVLNGAS